MLFGSRSENGGGMMSSSFGRRRSCLLFPWTVGIRVSNGRKRSNSVGQATVWTNQVLKNIQNAPAT